MVPGSEKDNTVIIQNLVTSTIQSMGLTVNVNGEPSVFIQPQDIQPRQGVAMKFDVPATGNLDVRIMGPTNTVSFRADYKPAPGTVVGEFSVSGTFLTGLVWDSQNMWVTDGAANMIHLIDVEKGLENGDCTSGNGCIIDSITIDVPGAIPSGLAWDGQFLWYSDRGTDSIYHLDQECGLQLGSFIVCALSSFVSPIAIPNGITWDGSFIWLASSAVDDVYRINTSTGVVNDSFDGLGPNSHGVAWDGQNIWHSDGVDDIIRKLDHAIGLSSGTCDSANSCVLSSFSAPGTGPFGLTWDGQFLWHADESSGKIYKIAP